MSHCWSFNMINYLSIKMINRYNYIFYSWFSVSLFNKINSKIGGKKLYVLKINAWAGHLENYFVHKLLTSKWESFVTNFVLQLQECKALVQLFLTSLKLKQNGEDIFLSSFSFPKEQYFFFTLISRILQFS